MYSLILNVFIPSYEWGVIFIQFFYNQFLCFWQIRTTWVVSIGYNLKKLLLVLSATPYWALWTEQRTCRCLRLCRILNISTIIDWSTLLWEFFFFFYFGSCSVFVAHRDAFAPPGRVATRRLLLWMYLLLMSRCSTTTTTTTLVH